MNIFVVIFLIVIGFFIGFFSFALVNISHEADEQSERMFNNFREQKREQT